MSRATGDLDLSKCSTATSDNIISSRSGAELERGSRGADAGSHGVRPSVKRQRSEREGERERQHSQMAQKSHDRMLLLLLLLQPFSG